LIESIFLLKKRNHGYYLICNDYPEKLKAPRVQIERISE